MGEFFGNDEEGFWDRRLYVEAHLVRKKEDRSSWRPVVEEQLVESGSEVVDEKIEERGRVEEEGTELAEEVIRKWQEKWGLL